MIQDPPHGCVLVIAEHADSARTIERSVAAAGERSVVLDARPGQRLDLPDGDGVDLIVTELGGAGRALLDPLYSESRLAAVPKLHLYRDTSALQALGEIGADALALALPWPVNATELQLRVRLAAEVGRLRRELSRCAIRDPLTGLYNRGHLLLRLEEEFSRSRRYRTPLSLVFFNIDRLKKINDAFGQSTGDSVLEQFGQLLRAQVRREDVAGRLGGDTLAVILPGNGCRGAATFANKVRNETESIVLRCEGEIFPVHVSAGICTYPDNATARVADDLVRITENALSEAKSRGGNRVFIDEAVLRHEPQVVLVADADPELLDLAEDLLTLDDYHVVRAESARVALETLRFRRPDLLVIDLHMADADGDVSLVEQIQSLYPSGEFPIIGLSRDAGTSAEDLARLGIDRFITKPFSVSLLRGAARELLGKTRTA